MPLHNKSFLINLDLAGPYSPSWDFISDNDWQNVLSNFVFKITDGFAFAGVYKKADLFPDELDFFTDWSLDIVGLAEAEDDIVCIFKLNDECQAKLLEYDFSVHTFESKKYSNYYEFDSLYFFSGERMIGYYIHHESEIMFFDLSDREAAFIESLEPHIKQSFIDSDVLKAAFEARLNT